MLFRSQRLAAGIDEPSIRDYERRRSSYAGIAVADIVGGTCSGCHMEISKSELDAIKRLAADVCAECPNCARLLVR